jgi:colicin import membrane protein
VKIRLDVLAALGLVLASCAGLAADPAQERRRIAAEKVAAEERFQAARRDCETRFAVSSCLEQARSERRRALEHLAGQQAVLDDAQRRRRAADRMAAIREKARQADERAAAPAASAVVRAPRQAPAPRPAASAAPAAGDDRAAVTPQQAAQRRSQRALREQQAQAHRETVQRRNAERAARKPPSAPLPVPAASGTRP